MNKEQFESQKFHDREARDRQLFNDSAALYCRKDLLPASRRARKLRLTETLRLAPLPAGARVLEVGCGTGFAASYLRDRFGTYTGVDYSENLIEYARLYNAFPNVHFIRTNIKTFRSDEPFDMIFLIGVLHHLDEMEQVLAQLVGLLKPGGWLVANEPQPTNPLIRLARFVRTKLDRGYSSEQLQLSAGQLRAAYAQAGLIDIRTKPQGLFSTPFAEIPMKPQWLAEPLSTVACLSDVAADRVLGRLLNPLTWNMVVAGRRPADNVARGSSRMSNAWGSS
jgi:2-polyprenyl-3-methyl-5-hydroxy-6-metoxy-1,4-benzoquinol methylase